MSLRKFCLKSKQRIADAISYSLKEGGGEERKVIGSPIPKRRYCTELIIVTGYSSKLNTVDCSFCH